MRLARESAQVVEDSGDLVLLTLFLAQLSLVELYAEGVTPGVLERALELEQLVGPLPTSSHTPTRVEGMRLMCADELEPAREALRRAHDIAAARGAHPATVRLSSSFSPCSSAAPGSGAAPTNMSRSWPRKGSSGA